MVSVGERCVRLSLIPSGDDSAKFKCLSFPQGTALDPLLDDSIVMAKRLRDVGQPVTLNVMDNLPHGFLCIFSTGNDPDLQAAHKLCLSYLQQGITGSSK